MAMCHTRAAGQRPSGPNVSPSTFSYFATSTQAAVLLHRATHLSGTWSPSTCFNFLFYLTFLISLQKCNHETIKITQTSFNRHTTSIDVFRAALPPLTRTTPVSSPVSPHGENYHFRTLLLAHALVDAAIIKLHGHFAYAYNAAGGYAADSASRQYCLDAAKRIVAGCGLVSSGEVVFVSPIMGVSYRATLDGINLAFYPVFPECTGSYILSSIYDSSNVLPPKKE